MVGLSAALDPELLRGESEGIEVEGGTESEGGEGRIATKNPLDESEGFKALCEACRRGDVKSVQALVAFGGVNVNAVDGFDYPPLTLASLCGHYEVVQFLLESGAICERDTFQGERCLYIALNNRIRNLLLEHDYSKSIDPAQPWASHISSLLNRSPLDTTDVTIMTTSVSSAILKEFRLHKFVLAARSAYFRRKLQPAVASEDTVGSAVTKIKPIKNIRLSGSIDSRAFETAVRFMYLGEVLETFSQEVLRNIEKISRHLEIPDLWELVLVVGDPKQRRHKRVESVEKAQQGMSEWFRQFVIGRKIVVDKHKAGSTRIEQQNETFADVILRADDDDEVEDEDDRERRLGGPRAVLYPTHKAMLRSEFFTTMFSSSFLEGQKPSEDSPLQIISLDTTPEVLEIILEFFYSEKVDIPLENALDVLFAADEFFVERLKTKAAQVISTAGNSNELPYSIYDVVRAGWLCRVRRLEEFGAKYIAERLEDYVEDEDFAALVGESAERIKHRQETDTIELIDDIRYYLNERFRLRMDDLAVEKLYIEQSNGEAKDGFDEEEKEKEEEEEDNFMTEESLKYESLLGQIDHLLDKLKLDA